MAEKPTLEEVQAIYPIADRLNTTKSERDIIRRVADDMGRTLLSLNRTGTINEMLAKYIEKEQAAEPPESPIEIPPQ